MSEKKKAAQRKTLCGDFMGRFELRHQTVSAADVTGSGYGHPSKPFVAFIKSATVDPLTASGIDFSCGLGLHI